MEHQFQPNAPIYLQLMERIQLRIVSGALLPGEKVLPVRELASLYEVNPNTMQRALTELEREGLLYTERTSGRFVTTDKVLISQTRKRLATEKTTEFLKAMQEIGCTNEEIAALLKDQLG